MLSGVQKIKVQQQYNIIKLEVLKKQLPNSFKPAFKIFRLIINFNKF